MRSSRLSRRRFLAATAGVGAGVVGWAWAQDQSGSSTQGPAKEQLPSWNNGPARTAIVDLVRRVTDKRGPDFVPPR